jgi:AAA domain
MISTTPLPLTDIRPESVAWLWPGFVPRGQLTLLDGDPNLGKSLTTIDLAARLSRGLPFADGTPGGTPTRTLIVQAEDGTASTLVPRLLAAGADLNHIFVLPDAVTRMLRLPRNLPTLERAIQSTRAELIIIDPLVAFLSRAICTGSDQMMRRVLGRMSGMAGRTNTGVIMVRHLNKTAGQRALYRGGGSIGIVGVARSALLAAEHPAGDGRKVLATLKTNLGPAPRALTYRIVGTESGSARIDWLEPIDLTADEALLPDDEPKSELAIVVATEWLAAALKNGPRPATEVIAAARAMDISEKTLQRAKEKVHVESKLIADKQTGVKRWLWKLWKPPFDLPEMPWETEGWDQTPNAETVRPKKRTRRESKPDETPATPSV